jgi:RNA polymerase sigma-70 factor (ECF subfamily)
MFYSVAIPGILPAGSGVIPSPGERSTQCRESVRASMTANKPVDARDEVLHEDVDKIAVCDDTSALSALYERFRRPIHSYAYRLLGSQEDADDVTQEVFVRVFTSWDGLHDRDNLSAWLYRIATNLCVDLLRRRKRISWWSLTPHKRNDEHVHGVLHDESFLLPSDNGGIPEVAERDHIRLAMAEMPEEYAVALILNVAQGVPYQEVAMIVGISPNAAATRISRAKKMFAEYYERVSCEGSGRHEKAGKQEK